MVALYDTSVWPVLSDAFRDYFGSYAPSGDAVKTAYVLAYVRTDVLQNGGTDLFSDGMSAAAMDTDIIRSDVDECGDGNGEIEQEPMSEIEHESISEIEQDWTLQNDQDWTSENAQESVSAIACNDVDFDAAGYVVERERSRSRSRSRERGRDANPLNDIPDPSNRCKRRRRRRRGKRVARSHAERGKEDC